MPIEHHGEMLYTPHEAAKKLGISTGMLRYHRNAGNIQGTELGTMTLYTEEQIRAAKLDQKKRGPKSKVDASSLMLVKDEKVGAAA